MKTSRDCKSHSKCITYSGIDLLVYLTRGDLLVDVWIKGNSRPKIDPSKILGDDTDLNSLFNLGDSK